MHFLDLIQFNSCSFYDLLKITSTLYQEMLTNEMKSSCFVVVENESVESQREKEREIQQSIFGLPNIFQKESLQHG